MALVSFWINAFIPLDVPGYTVTIPKGIHTGKTAVPLPGIARTWPGNTFKDWNAGYLTDQRDFDPAVTASRRMQSWAEVDLGSLAMVSQSHTSSGTTEVNLVSGVQTGFAVADMSRCGFTPAPPGAPPFGGVGAIFGASRGGSTIPKPPPMPTGGMTKGSVTLRLSAAAGDPLVGMAADIDYVGVVTIEVDPPSVTVSFEGKIDAFPAYDCYARYNGVTKPLFTSSPPKGNTVANLLGPANRPISGSVTFL